MISAITKNAIREVKAYYKRSEDDPGVNKLIKHYLRVVFINAEIDLLNSSIEKRLVH